MKNQILYSSLHKALNKELISTQDRVLVVCGGMYDKGVLESLGFQHVTISNLDVRMKGNEFAPFDWSFQDAEQLSFPDNHFDWVMVHAGLHHCHSPHAALVEMMRVGKKGVIGFEARNSWLIRLSLKLGLGPIYEIEAVVANGLKYGGVSNGPIPNFVYRWNESEVRKLTYSYLPAYQDHQFHFFYNLRIPFMRLKRSKNPLKVLAAHLLAFPLKAWTFLFPRQSNEFGFLVKKGTTLHDWLIEEGGEILINPAYIEERYHIPKAQQADSIETEEEKETPVEVPV